MVQSVQTGEGEEGEAPGIDQETALYQAVTEGRSLDTSMASDRDDPDEEHVPARSTPTRAEIEQELESLSRGPFKRILADYLGFSPTAAALRRFADKSPDKWANSVGILAQLAGFKKDVVEVNNFMMIGHMDDATLYRKLQEAEAQFASSSRLIETPQPVQTLRERDPSSDPSIVDVQATVVPEK